MDGRRGAPLGYDVRDRKLHVNDDEADTLRMIFDRSAKLGSARAHELRGGLRASRHVGRNLGVIDGARWREEFGRVTRRGSAAYWVQQRQRPEGAMVSVVNGFVCQSGCDEAVARKGRDPRNPKNDPAKAEALAVRDGKAAATNAATGTRASEIVSFGKDQSTVAAPSDAKSDRRNPASPALFYDRSA